MNNKSKIEQCVDVASDFVSKYIIIFLLLGLFILFNGYTCFRSDHLTQIPLYYKTIDKSLYPNDYFFKYSGQDNLRRLHLFLIRIADSLFGLPLGIFIVFFILLFGIFIFFYKNS